MSSPSDIKPGETWRDDQVKGLMLRHRGATKSWHVYYRTKSGQERRPKIGEFPTLQLKQARDLAKDYLRRVWAGEDPSLEKKLGRQASATVSDLCDTYMERHGAKKKSSRTDASNIKNHIRPQLGGYAVAEIAPRHIAALHAKLSLTKPTQANRVVALLSKMFSLAERWEMRPQATNPCRGIERNREKKRRRYMTPDEAAKIAAVLAERMKGPDRLSVLAVSLLLLTGARRGEICGRVLRVVGDELYLSDSKEGGEKWIQVPAVGLKLIEREKLNGVEMPPADHVTHFWQEVREAAGVENLHVHDLRHTFASIGISDVGLALPGVGGLLGHASAQTTSRYAHLMKDTRRAAADAIGERAMALLTAPAQPAADALADGVADGRPADDDRGDVKDDGLEPADHEAGALVG